jgi:hypothetical protein
VISGPCATAVPGFARALVWTSYHRHETLVSAENLTTGLVVMESTEDRERSDAPGPLNRARSQRIIV